MLNALLTVPSVRCAYRIPLSDGTKKKQFVKVIENLLLCNILQTLCKHYFHNVSESVLVQELILLIIVVMITIYNTLIVSYR